MDRLVHEIRFAIRSLSRRPGFTTVAALTLALGIGANTAIFTVVNGVLLDPLPYSGPEGLFMVWASWDEPDGGSVHGVMSYPDLADVEAQAPSIESLVGFDDSSYTLTGMGEPVLVQTARLSKGLLETFRLAPAVGRDIRLEEFGPDAAAVVVIGYPFWQERFGSDPDVLGQTLTLNGISYEIVGVAPEGFEFPSRTQLWVPRNIDIEEGCARGCHTWESIGRLAPGATLTSAQSEADAIAANLQEAYPDTNFEKEFLLVSLLDEVVGDVRAGLWVLLGAVGAVLLIACANVANLLLARASARRGEVAVRAALGASPSRLAGGLLLESVGLALIGGAGGLLLAGGGVGLLQRMSAGTVPRVETIGIDGTVLLFTSGLVAAVTLIFGLSPAIQLSRTPLASNLTAAGRGADGGGGRRLRTALTAAEMGLSVVLLIGAGLLLRTFGQLYAVDVGFETREVLRFTLSLPSARYPELEQVRTFYRSLEEQIAALPGVESVGSAYGAPFGRGWTSGTVLVEGRPEPEPSEETGAAIHGVSPHYLETMQIPLLRGRLLGPEDDTGGFLAAVVNETFVRENFPDEEPIGKRVRITVNMGYGSPTWEIVGVIGDIRARSLTRGPVAEIYVPQGQFGPSFMTVSARSVPGAGPLIGPIRSLVRAMDPNLPLQSVETVTEAVSRLVAPTRFFLTVVGLFAALAMVLAAIGLYGVMAYLVSGRTQEIGVRVALGAQRAEIVRMVLIDGMRPALAGLTAGLAIALAGGRVIESLLYGVTPRDPWIYLSVPVVLSLVAVAAILLPASRASRVDPIEALRTE